MGIIGSWLFELGMPWPMTALILYAVFGIPSILLFLALGSVRIRERMMTLDVHVGPVSAQEY